VELVGRLHFVVEQLVLEEQWVEELVGKWAVERNLILEL